MNSFDSQKQFYDEFKSFLDESGEKPPPVLSETILSKVTSDLSPSALRVFFKLCMIVAFTSSFSLLFCPQLGIGNHSGLLMRYFMKFGPGTCSIVCGAFFTAFSFTCASFILKPEEMRILRATRFLQLSSLTALSLGVLVCLGAEALFTSAILWLIGGIFGGIITLEVGYKLEQRALARRI